MGDTEFDRLTAVMSAVRRELQEENIKLNLFLQQLIAYCHKMFEITDAAKYAQIGAEIEELDQMRVEDTERTDLIMQDLIEYCSLLAEEKETAWVGELVDELGKMNKQRRDEAELIDRVIQKLVNFCHCSHLSSTFKEVWEFAK